MDNEEQQETTLRDDITAAMTEIQEKPAAGEDTTTPSQTQEGRDDKGRFKGKDIITEPVATAPAVVDAPKVEDAPQSLSPAAKAKWAALDPDLRQEWSKREADIHKMMTSGDGELQMGRKLKEVITPYMAVIQSAGFTPETAIQGLLNTDYKLRSSSPAEKAQMVQTIIKQYGVDMSLAQDMQQQEGQDPTIAALQQQIAQLQQMANPEAIYQKFTEKSESEKINTEVRAFASDPANKYYEQVKPLMAALLGSGTSQSMKEAYDAACKAHPTVSSMLEAEKSVSLKAKQAEEIAGKRKAAASVTGSPGATIPNSGAPNRSLREEIAANLRAAQSS